jgi:tRNA(Ile)-lysidine synthase
MDSGLPNRRKPLHESVVVAAVSGGPDSVHLLRKLASEKGRRIVVGHVNYRTRGSDSEKDQALVEKICKTMGYEFHAHMFAGKPTVKRPPRVEEKESTGSFPPGFERMARDVRYRFLRDLSQKVGAETVALAHTADDQIETILMRIFEGAGIGGLKGIPRKGEGIERPILDEWKEEILKELRKRKIPFRVDRSNFDTRFERNWVRNVLIPLLEQRYGKSIKKRIFTLGERFRELDDYLETEAAKWIRRNVKISPARAGYLKDGTAGKIRENHLRETPSRNSSGKGSIPRMSPPLDKKTGWKCGDGIVLQRKPFAVLPSALRVKILQRICFDHLGIAPNERLIKLLDGNIADGGPSARVNAGKDWEVANRYAETHFVHGKNGKGGKSEGSTSGELGIGKISGKENFPGENLPSAPVNTPGNHPVPFPSREGSIILAWEARRLITPAQAKRLAEKRDGVAFDEDALKLPLSVRPLRAGDRILPFGRDIGSKPMGGNKKVKDILIDRKIPKEERWGRPVVCDAEGRILWIPGVLRSDHAPVTAATRKTAILRIRATK